MIYRRCCKIMMMTRGSVSPPGWCALGGIEQLRVE